MIDPSRFKPAAGPAGLLCCRASRACSKPALPPKIEMAIPPGFMEAVQQALAEKPWLTTG